MNELDPFISHIQKRIDLTPEELAEILSAFKLRKVKKRQFIIQPDFVAKYRTYILQGAFRSYVIGQDGVDHTIQFALEDWWISDINSYLGQKPATMFVVAIEDSTVLQIEHDAEQALKAANHKFETFFRIGAERTAAFHQRRIISALTRTAEERYNDFLETYPRVAQRLPQYALASYLGMTTEFLSKIRNNKVRRKS
ncbi:Crp/Fnr family transcriptional regulator [Mucilaginibacter agri]|uniref:Cyclic nucleotide-binding domain-containing protein n=1 Tax=Mucilaginibacter agri TaxID=2695265 RepID=A0A965ZLJ0_9SPHI|nr:Crp/Fnr family transcriptional regulator [Mucilaginibacter agri]NCD71852.1 cyclic nucleotide-binding domain-containing protein [Mucilaginibacter agri]